MYSLINVMHSVRIVYIAVVLCLLQVGCTPVGNALSHRSDSMSNVTPSGYLYIDNGMNVVIDARGYPDARRFSEGLAAVMTREGSYGFIDKKGKMVIEPQFDDVGDFSEGLALVRLKDTTEKRVNGFCYIDRSGTVIIKTEFAQVHNFSEGVAVGHDADSTFLIHKDGRVKRFLDRRRFVVEPESYIGFRDGRLPVQDVTTGKYGYVDKNSDVIIPATFEHASMFSGGLARVSIVSEGTEFVGFINIAGEFKIPPQFDVDFDFSRSAQDFSEDLAGVIDGPPTISSDSHFVFIDRSGAVKIRTRYAWVQPFSEGLAAAYDSQRNRFSYIDKRGIPVTSQTFLIAGSFSDGLALVARED